MVIFDSETGQVKRFVEKPTEFVGNRINAGIYLLNSSVISRIPVGRHSLARFITLPLLSTLFFLVSIA